MVNRAMGPPVAGTRWGAMFGRQRAVSDELPHEESSSPTATAVATAIPPPISFRPLTSMWVEYRRRAGCGQPQNCPVVEFFRQTGGCDGIRGAEERTAGREGGQSDRDRPEVRPGEHPPCLVRA